jgi:hypothetical protein
MTNWNYTLPSEGYLLEVSRRVFFESELKVVFTAVLHRLHIPFALELSRTGVPRELHSDLMSGILSRVPGTKLIGLRQSHSVCFDRKGSIDSELTDIIIADSGNLTRATVELERTLVRSVPSVVLLILTWPGPVFEVIFLVDLIFGSRLINEHMVCSPWLAFVSFATENSSENGRNDRKNTTQHTSDNNSVSLTFITSTRATPARSRTTYDQ